MAKDKSEKSEGSGGIGGFLVAVVIGLLLGAGGGGAYGYFLLPDASAPPPQSAATAAPAPIPGRFPNDAVELAIPSVITDLETDPKIRARLDLSIIVAHGTPETTTLLGEVREDVIAYLKGLTLADIQGARGFQNLREQLDDRARIRGRGAILGLLIGGLVLE
ncbi:flagellar basal body-associated FliL family protein [Hyphomicrobium sp.]|uniref:flagellar basal body-associated FliL family protein n=1 Tax=Hyphomicrobium sp. TaxID=82 RepID=UPI000FB0EF35|nr:flagellar basal body-associated FliL family protein [Hyphomicrobium sp.]RUO98716.1 MAG: flagellar basal body-associated FliL family protein [Hyphomicrobium sp.]